jgi:undecaprenyl diphosphate synthase
LSSSTNTPQHIGIILDGNRRWAKANGKKSLEGHKKGSEVFKDISIGLFDRGVKYISAFVFSTENWKRTTEEVDYLMRLVVKAVESQLDDYNQRGIRIQVLGSRERVKKSVLKALQRTEEKTASNTEGTLALCFNYGGREELVDAVKSIVADGTAAEAIQESTITEKLYGANIPDIDLLIRTSGEQRISGFMLWRSSYAEMYFMDIYWPDATMQDFDTAIKVYDDRQRRFGC